VERFTSRDIVGARLELPVGRTAGRSSATHWLSWLLGTAVLGTVVAAALHVSEERAFVRLVERAQPWWLGAAAALQAGTYVAQGWIWRLVGAAADCRLSRRAALELAFAKLFTDQALPSAGLSSSILIAKGLERRRLPSAAVNASVLVNVASYHLAYVAALLGALVMLHRRGDANALVTVTAVLFLLFSLVLSVTVLGLSGHRHDRSTGRLQKIPGLSTMLDFMSGADVRLVRSPSLLATAIALQGAIVLLDAATVWILIRALGVTASVGGVFVSFMIASLFRTMGVVPGGLGTFEATSVLMLRMVGIDVAVALSATLLFRGLSFWLPMLPGYWCSRRVLAEPGPT
jgi:Mg2+-importing ATPase